MVEYDTKDELKRVKKALDDKTDSSERRINELQKHHTEALTRVYDKLDDIKTDVGVLDKKIALVDQKLDGMVTRTELVQKIGKIQAWARDNLDRAVKDCKGSLADEMTEVMDHHLAVNHKSSDPPGAKRWSNKVILILGGSIVALTTVITVLCKLIPILLKN